MAVDRHDGADGAAAEAVDGFEGELAVRSRRPGGDAQALLELLDDADAAADVAGRAEADGDDVLPFRLEGEGFIERGR
jgi:hypothetical protein